MTSKLFITSNITFPKSLFCSTADIHSYNNPVTYAADFHTKIFTQTATSNSIQYSHYLHAQNATLHDIMGSSSISSLICCHNLSESQPNDYFQFLFNHTIFHT